MRSEYELLRFMWRRTAAIRSSIWKAAEPRVWVMTFMERLFNRRCAGIRRLRSKDRGLRAHVHRNGAQRRYRFLHRLDVLQAAAALQTPSLVLRSSA